ncbi:hypothetical protein [Halocatena halophila]|uniref:hypothetical protein n=1 Tax=Halocatena halophila TaxID=2814576 RepID=UPI002ED6263E
MTSDSSTKQFDETHRCRTITTDHRMVRTCESVFGAAICPHNGCRTPLHGDPSAFENTAFRCLGCNWIVIIDQVAIDGL